jgi:hypothetical protein
VQTPASRYVVDFPTLWVVPAWIEWHCLIPDGFRRGQPFRMYDWQLWCTVNHYRIKPNAEQDADFLAGDLEAMPVRSEAFHNRRSQVIAPQKTGKGPWSATIICAEARGPVLFFDWAGEGDWYLCADHGCGCGWAYKYQPGEPMGMPWPTPLIQLLATSEDQVDNVYRPLQAMARGPRLKDRMLVREGFIRLTGGDDPDPDLNRIDVVTSSALSRLGAPITGYLHDETQLYNVTNKLVKVAETMRRGCSAMGGRGLETTNCFDPSEGSVAQRTYESASKDIFKFYEPPPPHLKYTVKAERRQIHALNYAGSPHADRHGIEAEATELLEKDPTQAERFYGNRIVYGAGSWCDGDKWKARKQLEDVPAKTPIVLGFDGSDVGDWTAIRAETQTGYQFTPTYGPDKRPCIWDPAEFGGQVPRLEVAAAFDELFGTFRVVRAYCDPPYWETEIDAMAAKYGEKIVVRWATWRVTQMHAAAERLYTDIHKTDSAWRHDGCETTAVHVRNARKQPRPPTRYVLAKPSANQKIDACVTSIICHEAAGDVTAAKLWPAPRSKVVVR